MLYNVVEAAEKIGISKHKLLRYVREGIVEPTRFSLTGRHQFNNKAIKKIKKLIQEQEEEQANLINLSEVANIMGVSLNTISKYMRQDIIKPIKSVNKVNYFDRKEIEDFSKSLGSTDFENLISSSQAAKILGVTASCINRYRRENRLIPDRTLPGGSHFFLKDKIVKIAELAEELAKENE